MVKLHQDLVDLQIRLRQILQNCILRTFDIHLEQRDALVVDVGGDGRKPPAGNGDCSGGRESSFEERGLGDCAGAVTGMARQGECQLTIVAGNGHRMMMKAWRQLLVPNPLDGTRRRVEPVNLNIILRDEIQVEFDVGRKTEGIHNVTQLQ